MGARRTAPSHIVQSRPITALPPPEADPPTDWTVPDPTGFYFRASIVEQLPDPLSPLFADLVDGSVTRSLTRADDASSLGPGAVRPGDVGLPTINGYAYYALHPVRDDPGHRCCSARACRMLGSRGAAGERWRTYARPRYQQVVGGLDRSRRSPGWRSADLLAGVVELLDAGTEYYTSVQTIIPLAATSEIAVHPVLRPPAYAAPATRRRRPSCSASTACRSARRSRSSTSPAGSRASRSWRRR